MTTIDLTIEKSRRANAIERAKERNIVIPTYAQMKDPSKIPALAEPWFLLFNADVQFHAVMTPEDLGRAGLDELGEKWS